MKLLVVEGAVDFLVKIDFIGTDREDQYSRELNMEPEGVNFQALTRSTDATDFEALDDTDGTFCPGGSAFLRVRMNSISTGEGPSLQT